MGEVEGHDDFAGGGVVFAHVGGVAEAEGSFGVIDGGLGFGEFWEGGVG